MQIACPQCAMQYSLDPKLLPPGGVPVQCTRCSHVFIATPSEEPASAPPPAVPVFTQPVPAGPPVPSIPPLVAPAGASTGQVAPQGQPMARHVTQVFGSPTPSSASLPSVPSVAPNPSPGPGKPGTPPSAMMTQVFGALPQPAQAQQTPPGTPPSTTKTQVFGALPPAQAQQTPPGTSPQVPPGMKSAPRPSQPAGAPPVASVPAPQPLTLAEVSTSDLEAVLQGLGEEPGAVGLPGDAQPPGSDGIAATTAIELPVEQPASMPRMTNPFGIPAVGAMGAPSTAPAVPEFPDIDILDSDPSEEGAAAPGAVQVQTSIELPPEEPGLSGRAASIELPPEEPGLSGRATSIELPSEEAETADRTTSIELPPEVPGTSGKAPPVLPSELLGGKAGGTSVKEAAEFSEQRRVRMVFAVLGLLVLGLTVFLTSPAWRRGGGSVSAEELAAKDEALSLLRRDDTASREEAIGRLRNLVSRYPQSIEFQAELTVALALQLDDMRLQMSTLQLGVDQLKYDIATLEKTRMPVDWQNRVNAKREELAILQQSQTPIGARIAALMNQVMEAEKKLQVARVDEPATDTLARLKARGMVAAVTGLGETFVLADELGRSGQHHWRAMVLAEYVVNNASAPEMLSQAFEALESVREQDSTYLRPYVLAARVALARKDPTTAQVMLDSVITLNPKHEIARLLQEQAAEAARKQGIQR